jgi:drug/metabolite transporter (DMT)-like permease
VPGARPGHGEPVLVVVLAVLFLSPDATIVSAMHANLATILVFRCGLMAVGYGCALGVRVGGVHRRTTWKLGWRGAAFAIATATSNVFFVASLHNTSIAHTLLISATVPAITAVLTRLTRAEPLRRKTVQAAIGMLIGIAGLVASNPGTTALVGDLEAFGGACALSAALLIAPRDDRLPAAQTLGAVLVVIAAASWAHPSTLRVQDLAVGVPGFLVLIPCASSTVWAARRYLRATELSLVVMLESVFGPMWGWIGLDQRPSWQTVAAGLVILASVGWHTLSSEGPVTQGAPAPSGLP